MTLWSWGSHLGGLGAALTCVAWGLAVGCGGKGAALPDQDGGSAGSGAAGGAGGTGAGGSGGTGPLADGLSILSGVPGGLGAADDVGVWARMNNPYGIVADGQGNLLFTDQTNGTVRKLDLVTRAVTTLAGTAGENLYRDGVGRDARFNFPRGIAVDGNDLYVADYGNGRIRKIALGTGEVTTFAGGGGPVGLDGTGGEASFGGPDGLALDGKGDLFVADSRTMTIRKIVIATGAVTTFAGSSEIRGGGDDGVGTGARFATPTGLAIDGNNLYVSEGTRNRIRRVDLTTAEVTTPFSDLTGVPSLNVYGLGADHQGHLYVADPMGNQLVRIDLTTGQADSFAGATGMFGIDDGPPPVGRLGRPWGLTVAADGALYLTEWISGTIRRVDPGTRAIETVAGQAPHPGSADGAGALFFAPDGVATDRAGDVFVADRGNTLIRRLTPASRVVATIAGQRGGFGNRDGVGDAASFTIPVDVAADPAGNLFVVDQGAYTIRRIELATKMVTTFAGMAGSIGSVDGVGGAARFWVPSGICHDGAGKLYVTDSPSYLIRGVDGVTAEVKTVAGPGDRGSPIGIVADGAGQVYIANSTTHTISKIVLATQAYTTIAGEPGVAGAVDGVGAAARFYQPTNLALDGRGSLFVAEPGNHLVRRIDLATGQVSTFVGTRGEAGLKTGPLPGRLNEPRGLAVLPSGDLVIADQVENVILIAR